MQSARARGKTAIWLLQHGADPHLQADGADALQLSVRYKMPQLRKLLEEQGMRLPPAATPPVGVAKTPLPVLESQLVSDAVRKSRKSPPELERALKALPAGALRNNPEYAISAMGGRDAVPVESWRTLFRAMGPNADFSKLHDPLAARVPYEAWPQLIAAGYPNASAEQALGCLLNDSTAQELKIMWPSLEKHFPDFRQAAARMLLQPYRMHTVERYCYEKSEPELKAKLQWLRANDIKGAVTGMAADSLAGLKPDTRLAMQPFLYKGPAAKARFAAAAPECKFAMTDAWFDWLASHRPELDKLEIVELPGEAECGLLVHWTDEPGYSSGLSDAFTGPVYESAPSCGDPLDNTAILRQQDGVITVTEGGTDEYSADLPTLVRDTQTGMRYYLDSGVRLGRCAGPQALPFIYEWRRKDASWQLAPSTNLQFREALYAESNVGKAQVSEVTLDQFLRQHAAARRSAYLAAVLALDKEKLTEIEAKPLPALWTVEAIKAVGNARMPLADKRKRIAHLFYRHDLLERALSSELMETLLTWLPQEDWGPLLKIAAKAPQRYYLDGVRIKAAEAGKGRLACDLDNVRGLLCGETLGQ